MKRFLEFFALSALLALGTACNRMTPEQMAAGADKIIVKPTPEILTLCRGKVPVELNVSFPKGFFYPEVVMVVTPVLVYEGGETEGLPIIYQGEKVKDNDKLVSTKGGSLTERVSFDYIDAMKNSHLELRAVLMYSGKTLQMPVRKVADGICTLEQLADLSGVCDYKKDDYQAILKKTAEAQVKYQVNSSTITGKQLKGESVEDYQDAIEDIKKNDRYTITGTQIVSYASPEGGQDYNAKLSDKRSDAAQKAWKTVGKGMEADDLEIKSIGQDWEGFKEAVANSNIPDKELILRVLSMYSNPAVRESEIKNLSKIYTEIKAEVFPELRRSRFVTNLDYRNYSEEELEILSQQKLYMLDEEALLRLAAVSESPERKEFIWNFAWEKYGSKRAAYNMAVFSYKTGKASATEFYLDRLADEDDPQVINLRGLVEMSRENWYKAEDLFEKANTEESRANIGVVNMLQANYEKAVKALPDGDCNKAVAALLYGDNDAAGKVLTGNDAKSDYLRAVLAARNGKKSEALNYIKEAGAKDASLAERAKTDIEFANCR